MSYESDLLDSVGFEGLRDYHGFLHFSPFREVEVKGSSLINIAKTRRVFRARSALEMGIARWRGLRSLKFMTLTLDPERASFSKTYVSGGLNACHTAFLKRIRRRYGEVEYIKVSVPLADSRHIHYIINAGWISQRWLSNVWNSITNCPVVDIRTLYYGRGLRNYLANYISNQGRLGYSFKWVFKGWRFLTNKIFSRLKNRYLPRFDACPYCANLFYRYVWYRRVLPLLMKRFKEDMLFRMVGVVEPVIHGNWVPKVINRNPWYVYEW